jgi:DNA-binding MarR family transcriptional regulator
VDDLMCEFMGVAKAIRRFMEQRFTENKLPPSLAGPRLGVLFPVQRPGGLRMGDLAERLGVNPRTVTDLVDGLERDGLLMRRPDPADRRATLLDLTPQARVDFERAHAASRSFLGEAFSPLTAAERKEFLRLLTKLRGGPIGKAPAGFAADPCRPSD